MSYVAHYYSHHMKYSFDFETEYEAISFFLGMLENGDGYPSRLEKDGKEILDEKQIFEKIRAMESGKEE